MSEIVKSEYNALGEDNNYKTHYFKTSADQVVGLGRMKSFSYSVGDVVYSDTNKKVALKCTTTGTTSNTELDISGRAVGESVEDGSVVWKVIARSNVLDENGVVPITNGGTGATTASEACANIGALPLSGGILSGELNVNGVSINGKADPQITLPERTTENHGGSMLFKPYPNQKSCQLDIYNNAFRLIGREYNQNTLAGNLSALWHFSLDVGLGTVDVTGEGILETNKTREKWHIKFASGLVIQGGDLYCNSTATVTYSVPMITSYVPVLTAIGTGQVGVQIVELEKYTNTYLEAHTNAEANVGWIVIGWWK